MESDSLRHLYLCNIYILTDNSDALRSAMEQRQHLRAADIAFLQEMDLDSLQLSGLPDELNMNVLVLIHAVFGDLSKAFKILDESLSTGLELEDAFYVILSICCEAHGRTDLLPTLQLLKQSQASVEQS
eukprot:19458-Heterococcus_DN1.PRE.4